MENAPLTPEPKLKVLEAMSFIYEICLKKDQYNINIESDFYKQILKSYNDLQLLRDDSLFLPVEMNLNDQLVRAQKANRIKELSSPPFNATKDNWMK
jgi:hypothetical protein